MSDPDAIQFEFEFANLTCLFDSSWQTISVGCHSRREAVSSAFESCRPLEWIEFEATDTSFHCFHLNSLEMF